MKHYLLATASLALLASPLQAEVDFVKLRQAEKISLTLTGKPMNAELRKKFLDEQITIEALAEDLSKGPGFVDYFAQYWTKLLGMQAPIEIYGLRTSYGQDVQSIFSRNWWWGMSWADEPGHNVQFLTDYVANHEAGTIELSIMECNDGPIIVWDGSSWMVPQLTRAVVDGIGADAGNPKPIQAGTKDLWQKLLNIAKETTASCEDSSATVPIKPWWDPAKVTIHARYAGVEFYKVPPKIIERCGPALVNCNMKKVERFDVAMDQIAYDISMEPSYLISRVVAEDRPFADVVTTNQTSMTGTYAYFLGNQGKALLGNFPGGSIADIASPIFNPGNIIDRSHHWVNRGPENAGVLTTPAFQILTNGRRAKANKAYETFLCKKFTVPDGAKADPGDSNPDLTKRAYCSYCHKSLEPMAAFFNRWPNTGVTNFIVDNSKDVNDSGRFNGFQGNGASAFGKILAEAENFDECGIRRAFEFVNGRKMTTIELENKVSSWLESYKNSSKSLRAVIKAMVLSPEFLDPKGAQQ